MWIECGQHPASVVVGLAEQGHTVQVQDVEDLQPDRYLGGDPLDLRRPDELHPALQQREVRPTCGVESDDLAVQHHHVPGQHGGDLAQLGIGRGDVVSVPADQPEVSLADLDDGPHAVPFALEMPVLPADVGQRAGGGQHRQQVGRWRPMLDLVVHAESSRLPRNHLLEVRLILGAAHQPLVALGCDTRPRTGFGPDQGETGRLPWHHRA